MKNAKEALLEFATFSFKDPETPHRYRTKLSLLAANASRSGSDLLTQPSVRSFTR